MGSYLPFEGGDDFSGFVCFRMHGAPSRCRALFALGPDEEDLPPDEVGDAIGEILNIVAGLVKSQMEPRGIKCTIGLPQYMESSKRLWPGRTAPRLKSGLDRFLDAWLSSGSVDL